MTLIPLLRPGVRRHYFISLRRFGRDRRARRFVFFWTGWLVYLVLYGWFFLGRFFRAPTSDTRAEVVTQDVIAVVLLACALLTLGLHRWLERRDRIPSILGEEHLDLVSRAAEERQLALAVWREMCFVAALVQRSGSEGAMRSTVLAPGAEVATRSWQRSRLLALGLWNDLPATVRDLLLLPDGHWSDDQRAKVDGLQEYVFTLRWSLHLDGELAPFSRLPKYASKEVVAVLGENTPAQPVLRPSWDVRVARDETYAYFDRFWLEAVARRIAGESLAPELRAQALMLKSQIDEDSGLSTDILVGAQTVSELDDATLLQMLVPSYRRWQMLHLLTRVASGEAPAGQVGELLLETILPTQAGDKPPVPSTAGPDTSATL